MTATVPLWGKLSDLCNNKLLVQLAILQDRGSDDVL